MEHDKKHEIPHKVMPHHEDKKHVGEMKKHQASTPKSSMPSKGMGMKGGK